MSILNALFPKISEASGQDHKDRPSEKINIIPIVIIMRANLRALLTVKETINNHFLLLLAKFQHSYSLRVLITTASSF